MRRLLGVLLAATALVAVPRVAAAADRAPTVRVAPFDRGCLALFQPQAVVGCVAPLETARSGRLVGASFPTACLNYALFLAHVCDGQVAAMSLVTVRRPPARFELLASVEGHRRGTLPLTDNYRATRPQLCVVVLVGSPKATAWGNCVPLARKGRTTVDLREGRTLSNGKPVFIAAAVFGDASAKIDRISYSVSTR